MKEFWKSVNICRSYGQLSRGSFLSEHGAQSLTCTTAPKIFRKIYLMYDILVCKSCSFRAILDYLYELWHCSLRYIATSGKILYSCTSTFPTLNYCGRILFKSLSYLYEVVRTFFFRRFWSFRVFDRNLTKLVAPPGNGNGNSLMCLKGTLLLKKRVKT